MSNDFINIVIVIGAVAALIGAVLGIINQKKAASQALKAYMDKIGVDMNRLKLVEGLAQALKKAGISNKDLEEYIARQQVLSKAGISLDVFTAIVEKAKVLTSHDQGKGLLKSLSDYGGINESIEDHRLKLHCWRSRPRDWNRWLSKKESSWQKWPN